MTLGVNFITFFQHQLEYMVFKSLSTSQTELNIISLNKDLNPNFYSFSGSWVLVVKWWTTNSGNIEFFSYVSRTWYMPNILDSWLKTFQCLWASWSPSKVFTLCTKKQMSLVSMAGRPWLDWPTLKEALHLGLLFLER